MTQLRIPAANIVVLEVPALFCTIDGVGIRNPASRQVVEEMCLHAKDRYPDIDIHCMVFDTENEFRAMLASGLAAYNRMVVIFDGAPHNRFSPVQVGGDKSVPSWTSGALWGLEVCASKMIGANPHTRVTTCALTTLGLFVKRFRAEIEKGHFPWGAPKKGARGPGDIVHIDQSLMSERERALNEGPNLAHAIAHRDFAAELPKGSRISWLRVPPSPLGYDGLALHSVTTALRSFEVACGRLALKDKNVRETVLMGVDIRDPRLRDIYIDPGVPCFSVSRPDLHWRADGLSASEIDEMPGGMPELVHIDAAYGLNEDRWTMFFDWLASEGPLVFVVSHEWSGCYIPETEWLVAHLRGKGYDVHLLTTDQMESVSISDEGVFLDGRKVGTLWRQFPIFETVGLLADLVVASRKGLVRMLPEFAHFGNKAWFHIFASHSSWFAETMDPAEFALLQDILPASHLVTGPNSFPCTLGSLGISSFAELQGLSESIRDTLVLKICGANSLAARSHGVLMGEGIKSAQWSDWVAGRREAQEPFLIQERFRTGVVRMPVWHASRRVAEMFSCRLLMRPWAYGSGGKEPVIVSVHGCAVPQQYFKVHGMVDMAVVPVELDYLSSAA